MTNVIKLPGNKKPANVNVAYAGNLADIDLDYTKLVRALLNRMVRDYIRKGGKLNQLALKSGLNKNTVSRLAYYETTRPQWHTVMSVLMAMDAMHEFAEITMSYARRNEK